MSLQAVEQDKRLKELIHRRLLTMPVEDRASLHPVLESTVVSWIVFGTSTYFVLVFADENDKKRVRELQEKKLRPFPGLIAQIEKRPVAFNVGTVKNTILDKPIVEGMYAFRLSKDSTLVIRDFAHCINIKEMGEYRYEIKLGYIISFGDEINQANLFDFLEGLILYSIRHLKRNNGI